MSRPTEFGAVLRGVLYARDLTQEWLAREIGVEPASLSRAMRGTRRPSAELVLSIGAALALPQVDRDKLLESAGYPLLSPQQPYPRREAKPPLMPPTSAGAAGAFPSPTEVGEESDLPPFERELRKLLGEYQLPYGDRIQVQQKLLAYARDLLRAKRWELDQRGG